MPSRSQIVEWCFKVAIVPQRGRVRFVVDREVPVSADGQNGAGGWNIWSGESLTSRINGSIAWRISVCEGYMASLYSCT